MSPVDSEEDLIALNNTSPVDSEEDLIAHIAEAAVSWHF
jgi:hypothetical protein